MRAALIAEYRKFTSTRMWWVLLIAMVAYLGFIGAALAFSMTTENAMQQPTTLVGADLARSIYALTSPIGYVFALVIGSLAVTGEFRHKTITASLLVEPRRGILLVAKLIAGIPMGLLYGVLGTLAVVATAARTQPHHGQAGAPPGATSCRCASVTRHNTTQNGCIVAANTRVSQRLTSE